MKKFCSKCGAQLDLGKRSCTACHAFNPYFIAGFTNTAKAEPAALHEIQQSVPETEVADKPAKQNDTYSELIKLRREQLEQQKKDSELKNELIKVKEETEQYKKETFNLVKEVQKELHDIELENKLLKERVELLNTIKPAEEVRPAPTEATVNERRVEPKKEAAAVAVMVLLVLVAGASLFYFSNSNKKPPVTAANIAPPVIKAAVPDNGNKNAAKTNTAQAAIGPQKLLTITANPAPPKTTPLPARVAPVTNKTEPAAFALTEARLRSDLVGKKLSGCDITINKSSEINSVGNLVLVDRLSASYLKYKCIVKVTQGSDVYTSSPYIYYSAEGTFIKIDGTNCE